MIALTGATGQLGRLVINALLQRGVPAAGIAALVRDPAKAAELQRLGVAVRTADYDRPETLAPALTGVTKLLLISSSELGRRLPQHRAVIEAAQAAGVGLLLYTSVLRADTSALGLAVDHRDTEALLRTSGLPFVILRNGWYHENYLASVPAALQLGALYGCAGEGRISSAARADYAEAAAVALTGGVAPGSVVELAGDTSYTLAEFAAELSRLSGKTIPYVNLPEAAYRTALEQAGLPTPLAGLLADSDAQAAQGALFDTSGTLRRLIGRATTPWTASLAEALRK